MSWWRRLWTRKRMDVELEKELRFHLEEHVAELIVQGHSQNEAQRLAHLELGGPQQVRENCRDARGARWLEDLWQDFRYALRALRERPGFSAMALLTLALGVGATSVMFTVINSVLLKPLSYPESERLVTLREHTEDFGEPWGFSYRIFRDCQNESHSLDLAAWTYGGGTVSAPGEPEYIVSRQISSELLPVLGITLPLGRVFHADEDRSGAPPVAIISYNFWQRRYGGSRTVIGESLVFEGKPYTVIGVTPAGFQIFAEGEADVLTPLGQNTEPQMANPSANFIHVLGRLRPGVTLKDARAEAALLARHRAEAYPQAYQGEGIVAVPLQQDLVGDVRSTLWLLLGAVSLLLLIACVNVASLLLARAVSRGRELAMRVALGASRGRLVRQCLTESALLSLIGGFLGIVFAAFGVRPFVLLWPGNLPRAEEVHLDWRVMLFALAASLLCGLLFGLAPALRAPAQEMGHALRAGSRTVVGSSRRLHSTFVVTEIALAAVLLVSAGILGRAMLRLAAVNPGVDVHNLVTAQVALSPWTTAEPAKARAAWQDFLLRTRRVPGVQSAALADIVPMREGENWLGYSITAALPPPNQTPSALASAATPDYLQVMGIPLRQGRFLDDHDQLGSEPVVVIDEMLAQHAFGGKDVIGRSLWVPAMGSGPLRVVGVVGHVLPSGAAGSSLSREGDQIYYPFAQVPDRLLHFFSSVMKVAVRTNISSWSVAEALRGEARRQGSDLYEVRTMEQLARASLARQRFLLQLFAVFAALALLLACIGIYGVLAYLTSQRVPEIGVRMALGATSHNVIWLVVRESLGMILVGAGLWIAASLATGHLLQRLVTGAQTIELATSALMISVLIAAALLASFVPARRASRVDPLHVLRQE